MISDSSSMESQSTKRRLSRRLSSHRLKMDDDGQSSSLKTEAEDDDYINHEGEKSCIAFKESLKKLQQEKDDWKKILTGIKEDAKNACNESLVLTLESCSDLLTEEDKEFLKNRPNYKAIIKDFDRLVNQSAIVSRENEKLEHSMQLIIEKAEFLQNKTKEYIFNLD